MHYLYQAMKLDSPIKKNLIILFVVSASLFIAYLFTAGSSST